MALIISQGPLPQDGDTVDPSTFLEAWISGTTITNFPVGAFTGGELQFVVSSTDPPATSERTLGMLWFQRGEGILFIYDPASSASRADWMAICGRRDLWFRPDLNVEGTVPGTPLGLATSTPHTLGSPDSFILAGESQAAGNFAPRWRPIWLARPFTEDAAGVSEAGYPSEFCLIALETAESFTGVYRGAELGFCDVRVASGYTGAGGFVGLVTTAAADVFDNFNANSQSPVTEVAGTTLYGILCDSSATVSTSAWTRRAFKLICPPITDTPNF